MYFEKKKIINELASSLDQFADFLSELGYEDDEKIEYENSITEENISENEVDLSNYDFNVEEPTDYIAGVNDEFSEAEDADFIENEVDLSNYDFNVEEPTDYIAGVDDEFSEAEDADFIENDLENENNESIDLEYDESDNDEIELDEQKLNIADTYDVDSIGTKVYLNSLLNNYESDIWNDVDPKYLEMYKGETAHLFDLGDSFNPIFEYGKNLNNYKKRIDETVTEYNEKLNKIRTNVDQNNFKKIVFDINAIKFSYMLLRLFVGISLVISFIFAMIFFIHGASNDFVVFQYNMFTPFVVLFFVGMSGVIILSTIEIKSMVNTHILFYIDTMNKTKHIRDYELNLKKKKRSPKLSHVLNYIIFFPVHLILLIPQIIIKRKAGQSYVPSWEPELVKKNFKNYNKGKIISLVFSIILLLVVAFSTITILSKSTLVANCEYVYEKIDSNSIAITGINISKYKEEDILLIPSKINDMEVKEVRTLDINGVSDVKKRDFSNSINQLVVENGVEKINANFSNFKNITSIDIAESVYHINNTSFLNLENIKNLRIPYIGIMVTNKTTVSQMLPNSVNKLETIELLKEDELVTDMFKDCTNLSEVILHESLKTINKNAITIALDYICIPSSVESISEGAFNTNTIVLLSGSKKAKYTITNPCIENYIDKQNSNNGNEYFNTEEGLYAIKIVGNTIPSTDGGNKVIGLLPGAVNANGELTIPISLKSAFRNSINGSISKLTILGSTKFSNGAINISTLDTLVINNNDFKNSISNIFNSKLTFINKVEIDNMTSISAGLLSNSKVKNISISNDCNSIEKHAFSGCTLLEKIKVPFIGESRNTTEIDNSLFGYFFGNDEALGGIKTTQTYNSMEFVCYIPNNLCEVEVTDATSIGYAAFSNMNMLSKVTLNSNVYKIGTNAFNNCNGLLIYIDKDSSNAIPNKDNWSGKQTVIYNDQVVKNNLYCGVFDEANELTLIEYFGSETSVTVPEKINGYKVVGLGRAFTKNNKITKLVIPNTVTKIVTGAFEGCSALTSLTIPFIGNDINSTGESALLGNLFGKSSQSGLIKINQDNNTYYIPSGLKEINITNATSIGLKALSNLTSLEKVTINSGVTSIGEKAFLNCSNLTELVIPSTVTTINKSCLEGCLNLVKISLPFIGKNTDSMSENALFGYLFSTSLNQKMTAVRQYYSSGSSNLYYIPSGLKEINITNATQLGYGALYGLNTIEKISLNDGLLTINSKAFENCSKLAELNIPTSVTTIGESCLGGCSSLVKISLPYIGNKKTSTGTNAVLSYLFNSIQASNMVKIVQYISTGSSVSRYIPSGLKEINITNATQIGYGALSGLTSLEKITINSGITLIGANAFLDCNKLTELIIPSTVTTMGESCLGGCSSLEKLQIPFVGNTKSSTDSAALFGYIFNNSSATGLTSISQYYAGSYYVNKYFPSGLKEIKITNATQIGYGAFYGLKMLEHIELNEGINTVKNIAFKNCTNIKEIIIPSSVTTLGTACFDGCIALENLTIPFVGVTPTSTGSNALLGILFGSSNVTGLVYINQYYDTSSTLGRYFPKNLKEITVSNATQIGYGAFYGLDMLLKVSLNENVTTIGNEAFAETNDVEIYIDKASTNKIPNESLWSDGQIVIYKDEIKTYGDYKYILDDNNKATIMAYTGKASTLDVPTRINNYEVVGIGRAFVNNVYLKNVVIPSNVTFIVKGAFKGCSSLESLTLPFVGNKVNSIGEHAEFGYIFDVSEAEGMVDVSQPNKTCSIPEGLKNIIITNATTIYNSAFSNLTMIEKIVLNEGITQIGNSAFYNCLNIREIIIPSTVTTIGSACLDSCSSLESLTIPFVGQTKTSSNSTSALFGYVFGVGSNPGLIAIKQYYSSSSSKSYYIPANLKEVTITNATQLSYGAFYGLNMLAKVNLNANITSIGNNAFYNCSDLIIYIDSTYQIANESSWCGGQTVVYKNEVKKTTDYSYIVNNEKITLIEYLGNNKKIEVPSLINGYKVVSIGKIFANTEIESLIVPSSVESFAKGALSGCTSLESLTIPFIGSTPTSTGKLAVLGYLFGSTETNKVKKIYNTNYSTYYYIPLSLQEITVTNETQIPSHSFYGMDMLSRVNLNSSITSIGTGAFYECKDLIIYIDKNSSNAILDELNWTNGESNGQIIVYKDQLMSNDNYSYIVDEINKTVRIIDYIGVSTTVVVPENINNYKVVDICLAFYKNNKITKLVIPNTVTKIANGALEGCTALESLTIPFVGRTVESTAENGTFGYLFGSNELEKTTPVSQYSSSSFRYIPLSLKEIIVTNANKININAFSNLEMVEKIVLNEGIKSLESYSFSNCINIKELIIPNSVTYIGDGCFTGCTSLKELIIPNSVTNIGVGCFAGCSSLESLTTPFIGNNQTSTGSYATLGYFFYNTPEEIQKDMVYVVQYYTSSATTKSYFPKNLKEVNITNAKQIRYGAFYGLNMIEKININIQYFSNLNENAFINCADNLIIKVNGEAYEIG